MKKTTMLYLMMIVSILCSLNLHIFCIAAADDANNNRPGLTDLNLKDKNDKIIRNIVLESMGTSYAYNGDAMNINVVDRNRAINILVTAKANCIGKEKDNQYIEELKNKAYEELKKKIGDFDEYVPISREEFCYLMCFVFYENDEYVKNIEFWEFKPMEDAFYDAGDISEYSKDAMQYLYNKGYIVGSKGYIYPNYPIEKGAYDEHSNVRKGVITEKNVEFILTAMVAEKLVDSFEKGSNIVETYWKEVPEHIQIIISLFFGAVITVIVERIPNLFSKKKA